MKSLLKKLLAVTLAVICFFSCCAFHGMDTLPEFVAPEEFDESREYEITFWAKNDTNVTQGNIYKQAIEDFMELYPNIHVTLRIFTDYKVIYSDVITNISTGTTPNVCITYPDHIATYKTGVNVVAPLDDLVSNPNYGLGGSSLKFDGPTEDEIIETYYNEGYLGDNLYALPYMRSTEALYINKDYVEKLGYTIPEVVTWDWIWEVSEAALKKNEDGTYFVNGQNVLIPFIYKSTDNMMISMLQQLGADYSTADGEIKIFNDTTKNLLKQINSHAASGAFSTFGIVSYPGNYFNAGQCIFAIDSTAGATWIGGSAPSQEIAEEDRKEFETVVTVIPQYDTENPQMISQGPSLCIFNKEDPQEVVASFIFAQYMLTNTVQIAYAQTEGYVPVTSKARESEEYQDYLSRSGEDNDLYYKTKIDATKLLLENTNNTFVTNVFNGSASLRDAAGALIEDVSYAPKRQLTVDDEYIEELFDKIATQKKLDQLGNGKLEKKEFGALPSTAIWLLACLGAAWVFIAIVAWLKYNRRAVKKKTAH